MNTLNMYTKIVLIVASDSKSYNLFIGHKKAMSRKKNRVDIFPNMNSFRDGFRTISRGQSSHSREWWKYLIDLMDGLIEEISNRMA